jgi:hypothetical protein
MADSEEKTQAQAQQPPESSALVVIATKEGGTREMIRGEGGRFQKKPRPLIPAIEFTRKERKALAALREGSKDDEYMIMFRSMLRLAQYEPKEGESWDAKMAMAKVKAAEWIRLSALGKPASSEQDLDRITTQPIKTVIVVAPSLMNPTVQPEKPTAALKTKPSFIDAEFETVPVERQLSAPSKD